MIDSFEKMLKSLCPYLSPQELFYSCPGEWGQKITDLRKNAENPLFLPPLDFFYFCPEEGCEEMTDLRKKC